jgi:hypothetical protein
VRGGGRTGGEWGKTPDCSNAVCSPKCVGKRVDLRLKMFGFNFIEREREKVSCKVLVCQRLKKKQKVTMSYYNGLG